MASAAQPGEPGMFVRRRQILAVTAGDIHVPSSRFRWYELVPHLCARGWKVTTVAASGSALCNSRNAPRLARALHSASILFIQKTLPHPALLHAAQRLGTAVVYDFDDALFVPMEGQTLPKDRVKRLSTTMRHAQLCVAGNTYLATWAGGRCPRVVVVPTSLDTSVWSPRVRKRHQGVKVGWVGTSPNLHYLEDVLDILSPQDGMPGNIEIVVVCDRPPTTTRSNVVFRPWQLTEERNLLADVDIGIMPLQDTPWARGKCAFKAIQFMSLGIPVVVSPVGTSATIVRHGVDGFHARSAAEWRQAVCRLATDSQLRTRMGMAARAHAQRDFDVADAAARMSEELDRLLRTPA